MSNLKTAATPEELDVLVAQRFFNHIMTGRAGAGVLSQNAYRAAAVYVVLEKAGIECVMTAISASAMAAINNHQRIMGLWGIEVHGQYLDNAGNVRVEDSQASARKFVQDWMETDYQQTPTSYTEEVFVQRDGFQAERVSLGDLGEDQAIFSKLRAEVMAEHMEVRLPDSATTNGPARPRM